MEEFTRLLPSSSSQHDYPAQKSGGTCRPSDVQVDKRDLAGRKWITLPRYSQPASERSRIPGEHHSLRCPVPREYHSTFLLRCYTKPETIPPLDSCHCGTCHPHLVLTALMQSSQILLPTAITKLCFTKAVPYEIQYLYILALMFFWGVILLY